MTVRSDFTSKLRAGEMLLGMWMTIPHPSIAEVLAQSGLDFLLIDGEHSPIPPEVLGTLLPCTELHKMPVIYRVSGNRTELIKCALDHGVTSLMIPMVNTTIQAKDVVSASKYPPMGTRGFGAWRASNFYLDASGYLKTANSETPIVVQIETTEAVKLVDEIAATPGLDALFVGPYDLALSMGLTPGQLHPDLILACKKVVAAARRNGIAAGIDVANVDMAEQYRDMGFTLLTYGADISLLLNGSRDLERILRLSVAS